MSFDIPARPAPALDPAPAGGSGYGAEEALLQGIAVELTALGERVMIRRTGEGRPFLCAIGVLPRFNEEINVVRRGGEVRAVWSWSEELPVHPGEAAAAIRRVINPTA
ncbi:hypothetical protein [Actinomadura macrotermitis]|uniref:Uncharacterized protein n=1 Tax=Actinomadura macrotermitis TaxID=2585200 RepID=A0A7K0BPY4_9ACTN|nr:hypothetical protein [Actinomadura macrotermitis]MQY03248.1 hypothetical protein [Actinomadura macrotermitis]